MLGNDRIFEGYSLRVVFLEPPIGSIARSEDFEMVSVPDLLARIDVDPYSRHRMIPLVFGTSFIFVMQELGHEAASVGWIGCISLGISLPVR
jgi:hypothetical protein